MKKTMKILTSLVLMPLLAFADNNLYMVVDLSGGTAATTYPISYLSDVPEGGWSDEYKTTKLVLRRIEPGTCVVTTDKPYYVGVFEVTQKQYALVTGNSPSYFSGDMRPVENVSYGMIRGENKGALYPNTILVDGDSFMGKLRLRTGMCFDLPTVAQWEYACRAGTTTEYSYGDSADGAYMWYCTNSGLCTHDVGTRNANPWGLYDMHGNVFEWCLEWTYNVGEYRLVHSGGWNHDAGYCTSTAGDRGGWPSGKNNESGFRLVMTPIVRHNDAEWVVDSSLVFAGNQVWRSGDISDSQSSYMSIDVDGDVTFSFAWKTSSEYECDWLRWYVDDVEQAAISGVADWSVQSAVLTPGKHKIWWEYSKDTLRTKNSDCGWVSAVSCTTPTNNQFSNGNFANGKNAWLSVGGSIEVEHYSIFSSSMPQGPSYMETSSYACELQSDNDSTIYQKITIPAGACYEISCMHGGRNKAGNGQSMSIGCIWEDSGIEITHDSFKSNAVPVMKIAGDGSVNGNLSTVDANKWSHIMTIIRNDSSTSRNAYVGFSAVSGGDALNGNLVTYAYVGSIVDMVDQTSLVAIDKGLVARYRFSGDYSDLTGNNHGLKRFVGTDTEHFKTNATQKGMVMCFDGATVLGTDKPFLIENSFTISCWCRSNLDTPLAEEGTSEGGDALIGPAQPEGISSAVGCGLAVRKTGVNVWEHGSSYRPVVMKCEMPLWSSWHHVVLTVADNGAPMLYIDGAYVKTGIQSGKKKCVYVGTDKNGNHLIGGSEDTSGFFDGDVANLRFYDRALNATEISELNQQESIENLTHEITLDATGGSPCEQIAVATNGAPVGVLPEALWEKHKFLGWYSDHVGGAKITSDMIARSNAVYYAHWFDTSFGGVTGATNVLWRTGGAANWNVEETADGWDVKSGTIGKSSETWIECVVTNGCRVSYDWKVSCEPGEDEEMYDYLSLKVDGEQMDAICGESGWTNGTVFVAGEGEHILRWTYQKDYRTSEGEDCGWLGRVKIDPEVPVTFDDNDATSGEVPTIATTYVGDTIVIPGTGTIAKSCHTFGGWKCGETVYDEGASFAISNNEVTFTAVWNAKLLGSVTLATPETSHVTTEKIGISFNVPENATTIRYTIDGSDPTIDSPIYTGPFEIGSKSVTVKAIAYAEDWFDSACATWELTRAPWSAPECLNNETRTFSFSGTADWIRDLDTTHDGEAAMRSGAIDDKQKSTIQMSVTGSGTVSFWCKVSSECDLEDGEVYDGLAVKVDGTDVLDGLLGGEVGWTNITIAVTGEGSHVVSWNYEKDKTGKSGDDCAWIDDLLWQADRAVVTAAETGGRDVVIGREWIEQDLVKRYGAGKAEQFRALFGTDYDLAVRKPTGKTMGGKAASVWQDYVAGTDPTDAASVFKSEVTVSNGMIYVSWTPNLNEDDQSRIYKIYGRKELATGDWKTPVQSWHRFFKVVVTLPTGTEGEGSAIADEGFASASEPVGVQLWENGPYWAEYNVGASQPEEYGSYFWWGDTVGYKMVSGSWTASDGSTKEFSFDSSSCPTSGKDAAELLSLGYIDSTGHLAPAHDAATVQFEAPWRTPTDEDWNALFNNCMLTWTTRNGVYGRLVTGKGDYESNSIFLPAAGCGEGLSLEDAGAYGAYWSSTPASGTSYYTRIFRFYSNVFNLFENQRFRGRSIRPVRGTSK